MVDGPHNTFVSYQLLKHLNNTEMNIVKEVVQRTAFCAHLDELQLSMCTEKDVAVRWKGVNKVRKPNIDEELLISTNDEVDEDVDATEKSREKAFKTLEK